jgi:prepilin-type N-terminal cleavage/methylation domain-containing protein
MTQISTRTGRGFTLIELLVVIAIIGILSAVVLASLDTARNKGADASVKSNLSTVLTQAELYYDSNGGYSSTNLTGISGSCTSTNGMFNQDSTIKAAITSATSITSGATEATDYRCSSSQSAYLIAARLKTSGFWCIDSSGKGVAEASLPAASIYVCP